MTTLGSLRRSLTSLAVVAAVGCSLVGGAGTRAQDATPVAPSLSPNPANCSTFATGLLNPRYLTVASDGAVYVTEAGNAGDEKIYAPIGEGTPAAAAAVLTTRGATGQVVKVAADGTVSVVAKNLESYSFGTDVVGPAGIAELNGRLYVAVGGPGPAIGAIASPAGENIVYEIDPATGSVAPIADIGAFEKAHNPDPNAVDSNLYGIAAGADGLLYIADAGGNDIYTLNPQTKELKLLAVIPGLPFGSKANPARGGKAEIDPVPTGVLADPAGGVWVGLLTGAPFPAGQAKVIHIAANGAITDAVTGLTMVTSLAAAPDGTLYVTELSTNLLSSPPATGDIIRVKADGTAEIADRDLWFPNDIAFDQAGNLYVIVNASSPAGAPAAGEVLKCTDVANASAGPSTAAAASPVATPASVATPEAGAGATASASVKLEDIYFDPKTLTIPANTDVTITVTNEGVSIHDFSIDGTQISTGTVAPGATVTVKVNLPAGTYTYYCNVPGHQAAGMAGTLTVK